MLPPSEHRAGTAGFILEVIGRTPTVALERLRSGGGRVFAKLESFSPNASSGDRLGHALLDAASQSGALRPGARVFEAGPGTAELALAMVCRMRRHPFTAVVPEGTSLERLQLLRAYGAKVELSPFIAGYAGAAQRAEAMARAESGYFVGTARSPLCVEIHTRGLAAELLATVDADGGRIDAFGVGIGSGATFTAVGRALRARYPRVALFAVEPARLGKPHRLEGLGLEAALLDRSLVGSTVAVTDEQAWAMRERLGKEQGLLVGLSAAASVFGALEVASKLDPSARVYTVCHNSGERTFSIAEQL